jgi:drug/metabolite transporter (DMT)-like permease
MLLFAVFACSTAAILIKASTTHPTLLGALRLLIAAGLLAPLAWRDHRKLPGQFTAVHAQRIVWPAVVLAAHFVSWGFGARMTLSAQASLVVNLCNVGQFVFAGALAWLLFDEVPKPIFYLASALVVAGVAMVVLRAPAQPRMR